MKATSSIFNSTSNRNATPKSLQKTNFLLAFSLCTQRLLRNRPNPADRHIDANHNGTNDIQHPPILLPVVPENDREHNTPKIPHRTSKARDDSISMRMHMRHKPE